MRARYPDAEGFVDRGGVKVGYEVFGEGEPAVVFAPLDPIVHSPRVEGPGALPRPPVSGHHHRPTRQRTF